MGKLPQPRQKAALGPLAQGDPIPPQEQVDRHLLRPPLCLFRPQGQLSLDAQPLCLTDFLERAAVAEGLAVGETYRCPQIHESLIIFTGPLVGHGLLHPGLELLFHLGIQNILGNVGHTGRHAQYVSVHSGHRLSKGDGGHRAGGVLPDAGQLHKLLTGIRKASAMLLHNDPRRFLQVAGAAVVAQALPKLHEFFLFHRRQSLHRGQSLHPARIVGDHRRHTGLLQHDLRHPHPVGILRPPPGQGAFIFVVPGQQRRGHGVEQFLFHQFSQNRVA